MIYNLLNVLMACSHYTGPERGQGPGTTGLYITLCTVHTTQLQGMGQGPLTTGLYITLCTVHTTQLQGMGQGPLTTGLYITLCTVHNAWDCNGTGTGNHRFIYYTMYCS